MSFLGGVRDWDQKLLILRPILGAFNKLDICDKVYPNDSAFAMTVYGNLGKWRRSRPTRKGGPKVFFDDLARTLGCEPHVTGVMLIDAPIDEFISYLPEAKRPLARMALKLGPEVDLPQLTEAAMTFAQLEDLESGDASPAAATKPHKLTVDRFKSMLVHNRGYIESITEGIHQGHINQRHYYLTPEATLGWNSLVRAEAYPTYDQCKAGLRALVDGAEWKTAIASRTPHVAIMLAGGGAPSKDMVFIRSLLELTGTAKLRYFIVDISTYMLFTSMWWIHDAIAGTPGGDRVDIQPVLSDVLELQEAKGLFRSGGSAVFAITGGTIGNLSEIEFFRSLNAVSEPGDLLVLSADTLDGMTTDQARD
ncbi:MAG: L-histidine N(alpha)-methyltransferase, partial [Alphaproteobacteria bacterium]